MKWINVDENYLNYLRAHESRIPRTDYGSNKYKPFFGILFEKDNLYYVTQVSHPQERHKKMKQQKDFYKIFNPKNPQQLLAVINLNYMFPIPKEYTYKFEKKKINTYRSFESEQSKNNYIALLNTELKVINTLNLESKSLNVYNLKYIKPHDKISQRCIDFKKMEQLAKLYDPYNDESKK